jgi:hypothetical protein
LATVRPLGPVRSWVGLGVVRGVQLGPWAAGFAEVRWPVTPTGTGAGSSAPPPYRLWGNMTTNSELSDSDFAMDEALAK